MPSKFRNAVGQLFGLSREGDLAKWESRKPDFEQQVSIRLGTKWKIDITVEKYMAETPETLNIEKPPGSLLTECMEGALLVGLDNFIGNYGEEGKTRLNQIARAHTISLEYQKTNVVDRWCRISPKGKLVIIFPDNFPPTYHFGWDRYLIDLEGAIREEEQNRLNPEGPRRRSRLNIH